VRLLALTPLGCSGVNAVSAIHFNNGKIQYNASNVSCVPILDFSNVPFKSSSYDLEIFTVVEVYRHKTQTNALAYVDTFGDYWRKMEVSLEGWE